MGWLLSPVNVKYYVTIWMNVLKEILLAAVYIYKYYGEYAVIDYVYSVKG